MTNGIINNTRNGLDKPAADVTEEMVVHGVDRSCRSGFRQEVLPQGCSAPGNPVAIGGEVRAGNHLIGQVGAVKGREYMEDHAASQNTGVHMAVLIFNEFQQTGKGGRFFTRFKNIVKDCHSLRGLAGAGSSHEGEVNEVFPDSTAQAFRQIMGIGGFLLPADSLEHFLRLSGNIYGDHRIGKCQGGLIFPGIASRRAPVSQTDGNEPVFIHAGKEIMEIAENGSGVFFDNLQIAAVTPCKVRQVGEHTVPGRAVAPFIAPAAGGNDPRQGAFLVLRRPDIPQPFPIAGFRAEVHQGMFGRDSSVSGPAVLFPMGAVGGEIEEVGKGGAAGEKLEQVGGLIGTGEAAPLLQIGVHHLIGEKLRGGLFRGDARYMDIAESIIGKTGEIFFQAATPAGIVVFLHKSRAGIAAVSEIDVVSIQDPVMEPFSVIGDDYLAGSAVYPQHCATGSIHAEIIQPAVSAGGDGNRRDLLGNDDRLRFTDAELPP